MRYFKITKMFVKLILFNAGIKKDMSILVRWKVKLGLKIFL